jgi:hypothetical protein
MRGRPSSGGRWPGLLPKGDRDGCADWNGGTPTPYSASGADSPRRTSSRTNAVVAPATSGHSSLPVTLGDVLGSWCSQAAVGPTSG